MAEPKYTLRRVGATATAQQGIVLANQLRPFFVGAPGPQGPQGISGNTIGGYAVSINGVGNGDLLSFSDGNWINRQQQILTDGGNF